MDDPIQEPPLADGATKTVAMIQLKYNPTTNLMTQAELIELSAFTLPAALASDPPYLRDMRRGKVKGASVDVILELRKFGIFDVPIGFEARASGEWPIMFWGAPHTKRGSPVVFGLLDLACVRLFLWMRRDGFSNTQIRNALRGNGAARACLVGSAGTRPTSQLLLAGNDACVADAEFFDAEPSFDCRGAVRFPIPWLGMWTDAVPRLQELRKAAPTVIRWRQSVRIEKLAAEQYQPAV